MKKDKKKVIKSYEEDMASVSEKEQELIDSYMDEGIENHLKQKAREESKLRRANEKILKEELEEDLKEFEIEDDFVEQKEDEIKDIEDYHEEEEQPRKVDKLKIFRIILVVLSILVVLAIIDIICVTKFQKGPFFAIPVHKFDDGGTTEYYGLGYKVIKYKQVQGRRDIELGTWSLKYNVEPIYSDIIDLAIEFNNDEEASVKKYSKQLLVVTGSLKEVDEENNKIVMSYEDEGGKYSIDLVCDMETDKKNLSILEPKYQISAMGTMINYDYKTKDKVPVIYLDNCFAEQ